MKPSQVNLEYPRTVAEAYGMTLDEIVQMRADLALIAGWAKPIAANPDLCDVPADVAAALARAPK